MNHLRWSRAMIPPGHHFLPTDGELIEFYLLQWSKGLPLPVNDLILEADVYGPHADPRLIFPDTTDPRWDFVSEKPFPDGTIMVTRVAYVLTKLSKINSGKTRIARRAGPGTWSGQTSREIHDEQQLLIGHMKMFTYEPDCRERRKADDHWIMHEYSLAGPCLDNERLKHTEYVICKITRVSKEMKKINRISKNREQVEKREFNGVCHKKPRTSSDVDENNTAAIVNLPFVDDAVVMEQLLADMPELSPDSIALTEEDFRILDNFIWE